MWFNNLKIYQFSQDPGFNQQQMEELLSEHAYKACSSLQMSSYGWDFCIPRIGKLYTHSIPEKTLVCARKEEKLLPASIINELVNEQVFEIEEKTGNKPGRKQKQQIKDELIQTLLPRAFSKNKRLYAFIDYKLKLLIVNTSASSQAEELTENLRKSLGSLPISPLKSEQNISTLLTDWLNEGSLPDDFSLGNSCVLKDSGEDGGSIRCSKLELDSDEIKTHLNAGKNVIQLSLIWDDRLQFVLTEDLVIKQLKMTDQLKDKQDDPAEDAAVSFDNDFHLLTLELEALLLRLLQLFSITNPSDHTGNS